LTITIWSGTNLGLVIDEIELAAMEEHLLWCEVCIERGEASDRYVDAIQAAASQMVVEY